MKLGPDLGLNALIQDNDEILCDGTPLHLACTLKAKACIDLLLTSGAPVKALNSVGEIPLHTFVNACRGEVGLSDIAIVAAFLRSGSPVQGTTTDGLELDRERIMGIPLGRLIALVDEYGAGLADGTIRPGPPPVIHRFLIEENGKLAEVDEMRLRSIVLGRLEGDSSKRSSVLAPESLPLAALLQIDVIRNAIEILHRARTPARTAPIATRE